MSPKPSCLSTCAGNAGKHPGTLNNKYSITWRSTAEVAAKEAAKEAAKAAWIKARLKEVAKIKQKTKQKQEDQMQNTGVIFWIQQLSLTSKSWSLEHKRPPAALPETVVDSGGHL